MDQWLLLALKLIRMVAYGSTTMILVPYLHEVGCTDEEIGLFMTLTLVGDVLLSTWITFGADRAGRRFMLGLSSILMLLSGVCFMFCTNFWILLTAAVFGVISPSGDEVGPFRAIEESSVAQLTSYETRSVLFAWQNLLGTAGLAVGSLAGGWLADLFTEKTGKPVDAYRVIFFVYTMCALASFVIVAKLSEAVEVKDGVHDATRDVDGAGVSSGSGPARREAAAQQAASPSNPQAEPDIAEELSAMRRASETTEQSSVRLGMADVEGGAGAPSGPFALSSTLCLLFGIDSLAYGFMTNSWLVEYMMRRFGSSSTIVGAFFFVSTLISALTSFPSARFSDLVGPVAAISLTKLGAGFFGAIVPLAGRHQLGAMAFIWLRSLFDTMDVVPRQMFITSVVPDVQRTRVLGLVNVVKTVGRAIGPTFTGYLASRGHLSWCFGIMGSLEWLFAVRIWTTFRHALEGAGAIRV